MKILLVSSTAFKVPPRKGGGVDSYTYNLADTLARLGHWVHIVVDINQKSKIHENIFVHQTKIPFLPFGTDLIEFHELRSGFLGIVRDDFISNLKAFRSALFALEHNSFDFDIMHCHSNLSSLLLSMFKRHTPLVYTLHNPTPWTCYYDSLFERFARTAAFRLAEQPAWRAADHIITLTHFLKEELMRWGLKQEKVTVVHSGVNEDFFNPNVPFIGKTLEHYGIREPYCLFVGQLFRRKGVHYLIRALKGIDINCVIIGDGPERENLTSIAEKLNLRHKVTFTGSIPLEDLRRIYAGANFFVSPSTAEVGVTLTILEAMSSGLPVVATNIPGVDEVINDGYNGFLIQPRNREELHNRLRLLSEDQKICKKMKIDARRTVEREFSWPAVAKKTALVYRSVINNIYVRY